MQSEQVNGACLKEPWVWESLWLLAFLEQEVVSQRPLHPAPALGFGHISTIHFDFSLHGVLWPPCCVSQRT